MKCYVFYKLEKDRKARPGAKKPFEDEQSAYATAFRLAQKFIENPVPFKIWVRDAAGEVLWVFELKGKTEITED